MIHNFYAVPVRAMRTDGDFAMNVFIVFLLC